MLKENLSIKCKIQATFTKGVIKKFLFYKILKIIIKK